jgi:hypothetical protein
MSAVKEQIEKAIAARTFTAQVAAARILEEVFQTRIGPTKTVVLIIDQFEELIFDFALRTNKRSSAIALQKSFPRELALSLGSGKSTLRSLELSQQGLPTTYRFKTFF